jgi:hypothetical protein
VVSLGCALKVERGREGKRADEGGKLGCMALGLRGTVDNLINIPRRDSKRKQNYECLFSSHSK